jgi:threonine-phosphate decarboxylase
MYHYQHGGDIYNRKNLPEGKKVLDFSANINPLGLPDSVKTALKKALPDCEHYPDPFCRELVKKLAAVHGVPVQDILCGNGAADVLFRLTAAVKPRRTLLLAPTFSDYEKAVLAAGSKVDYYPLLERDDFALGRGILQAITKRIEMVILCTPNNPTGQVIEAGLLQEIVAKCETMGIRLLVDECFLDFVEGGEKLSLVADLAAHKQLVILKAFTKMYAMPGLRLGYCLTADTDLLEQVRSGSQDWSVSVLAQAAGVAALGETAYVRETRELISGERAYLMTQLRRTGFKVYPGRANFLLCRRQDKTNWVSALRKQGFLIRDCSNFQNLGPGYYRVAVKDRRANRLLIKTIKEIIKHALTDDHH